MSLRNLLQQVAGTDLADDLQLAIGTVLSIQHTTATCTVMLTGGLTNNTRSGVKLMATVSDGFYLVPAVDSQVLVAWSTRNAPYIAMFGEIDDVYLEANNLVTLQGSNYGGLVKISDLVTKLNNLENKVNSIINIYNGHVHANPEGGTVGPVSTPVSGTLTPTQVSDLENKKVVHGD